MDFSTVKAIWYKMKSCYVGDNKVKQANLQGFSMQFETLKMNDVEDIPKYFPRVDEVVNTIRGLDEKLEEPLVVQKVLRSFPERFIPKVSAIDEMTELKTLT